jgi:serine/threonine protein kinase
VRGEHEIDVRADIYSLGATFYYLVTGRLPFSAETIIDMLNKQLTEMPLMPNQYNKKLSIRISGLIIKMLQKDKAQRYQSPQELIKILEAHRDSVLSPRQPVNSVVVKPNKTCLIKKDYSSQELERLRQLARLRLRQKKRE